MRRKTAPKVRGGRVQKKNRWEQSGLADTESPTIERERPGRGYRHLLSRRDIKAFIELLPTWSELSHGLERIVLAREEDAMGYHEPGTVAICAWEDELWWRDADSEWQAEHRGLLDRLDVVTTEDEARLVVKWTEGQARAFQLLHVFVHELGHHHDRMTTKSQRESARGEPFAEAYARQHGDAIWSEYARLFEI